MFVVFSLLRIIVSAQPGTSASKPYPVIDSYWKNYYSKGDEAMAIKFVGDKMFIQKFNTKKPELISTRSFDYTPDEKGIQIRKATKMLISA